MVKACRSYLLTHLRLARSGGESSKGNYCLLPPSAKCRGKRSAVALGLVKITVKQYFKLAGHFNENGPDILTLSVSKI